MAEHQNSKFTTKFFDRLSDDLTRLLEDPMDYNVSIEVGETPDDQIFNVHSCILQSRSPYFKKRLSEIPLNDEHVKTLKLPGTSVKAFTIVIR